MERFLERQGVEKHPFRSTGTVAGTMAKNHDQPIEIIHGTMERPRWNEPPVFGGRSFQSVA